ncbi:MAG: STAS/SEC14 domain-containing protein [Rhodocyclaceae bacterium]|nr:STAS/SEC14 domain-containing protein [Rhodocyclaceae bacterium]
MTAEEYLESMREIHGDPRFDGISYSINDFLGVVGFDVGQDTIVDMAAASLGARYTNPKIRVALVTCDERIDALGRLFASKDLTSFPTHVFPTLEEARDWIGNAANPDATRTNSQTMQAACLRCKQAVPVDDDGFCGPCLKAMEQACL